MWLKLFDCYENIVEGTEMKVDNLRWLLDDLITKCIEMSVSEQKLQDLLDAFSDRADKWDRCGMRGIGKAYRDSFDYLDYKFYSEIYND